MNILMGIGDIHLRDKAFYKKGIDGFLQWFDSKIPDTKKDCTEIMIAGDIFDRISLLPETSALAIKFFDVLRRKASTVYTILGNHDYGLTQYHVKNVTPFLKKLHVQVIEEPCTIETKLGFRILCLPWAYNLSHVKINEYIKNNCTGQSYDACVSHWEISPLFDSPNIDLSEVQSASFYCGHIHSHSADNKYLGSILPNSIPEVKENDNSILRMLVKKDDGTCITKDLTIPSFISIKTLHIQSLADLDQYSNVVNNNVFFKIKYNTNLTVTNIENKCNLLNIQVYSIEPEHKEEEEDVNILLQENFLNNKVYVPKNHKDLLQKYAGQFTLSEKEFALAQKLVEEVDM